MKINLLVLLAFFAQKVVAQYVDGPFYFVNLGPTGPAGVTVGANFIATNGWGGSATYNFMVLNSKNKPSDYQPGRSAFSFFGDDIYDMVSAGSLRGLKMFPTRSAKLRFGVEAGPAFVKTWVADHFVRQNIPPDIFGNYANYKYEEVVSTTVGLSVRGSFTWAISRPFGLEVGVISNINAKRSYFGLDTVLLFGHVRDQL